MSAAVKSKKVAKTAKTRTLKQMLLKVNKAGNVSAPFTCRSNPDRY